MLTHLKEGGEREASKLWHVSSSRETQGGLDIFSLAVQ